MFALSRAAIRCIFRMAALIAVHQSLQSILTEDSISCATTDEAIATFSDFWMTAMLPEFVLAENKIAIRDLAPAAD